MRKELYNETTVPHQDEYEPFQSNNHDEDNFESNDHEGIRHHRYEQKEWRH